MSLQDPSLQVERYLRFIHAKKWCISSSIGVRSERKANGVAGLFLGYFCNSLLLLINGDRFIEEIKRIKEYKNP